MTQKKRYTLRLKILVQTLVDIMSFDITLTAGTTDPTIGLIDLIENGYYKYNVYQQVDQFNLDPNQTSGIVENGKLYVKGELKPVTTSYTENEENTYKAYQ